MKRALEVWVDATRVGKLESSHGAWSFTYDPAWTTADGAFALSPHLPLGAVLHVDTPDDKRVFWFFDNLLPEGGIRQALARDATLDHRDAFGLLERFGEDSAGALTLVPEGHSGLPNGAYDVLDNSQLRALISKLPSIPLLSADGRARMSLAGAQHKLPIHRREGQLLLPTQGAPSSWILKPDNARPEEFPFCPANEHFCMNLARAMGLRVPNTELWHLPEPVYAIERFDRETTQDQVVRRHQVDLCQLLNKWPGYKYESDGGATFQDCYRALDQTRQPAAARDQVLKWLVFNYLIGNSDAHAKNISFLVTPQGISLAPFYDLLSVRVYGDEYDYLAMSIGDTNRYEWVDPSHWDELAGSISLSGRFLERLRRRMAEEIVGKAKSQLGDPVYTPKERGLLAKVVDMVEDLSARTQDRR